MNQTVTVLEQREAGLWVLEMREDRRGQRIRLLPETGAMIVEYSVVEEGREIPLLDSPPDLESAAREPMSWGCPILFPFPGRVRHGEFLFEGESYKLSESFLGPHHIHGLVYNRPWRVERCHAGPAGASANLKLRSRDFPEIKKQFPFPFEISVEYVLTPAGLAFSTQVQNTGSGPLPMGLGLHPYFRLPLDPAATPDRCRIRVPAKARWELEELIPTGRVVPVSGPYDLREGRSLDDLELDDVFTELEEARGDAPVRCDLEDEAAGLRMVFEAAAAFREIVVYTPPGRSSVCIEPYTCAPDAANLEARGIESGLRVLRPGDRFHASVRLGVERLGETEPGS